MLNQRWNRVVVSVVAGLAASLSATLAEAVIVSPGASGVPLSFASYPATVIRDANIPFEIRGTGGALLSSGVFRDRVVRTTSGDLAFERAIVSTQAGLNGIIRSIDTTRFAGSVTDVSYGSQFFGTPRPQSASRSADGNTLTYDFGTDLVFSGSGSAWLFNITSARFYSLTGSVTIRLSTGQSVTLSGLAEPTNDSSPPEVVITAPGPLGCNCNPVTITGTANDPDGTFQQYTVEYQPISGGAWSTITTSTTPVVNGTLASWNTAAIPQGYYFIRVNACNVLGYCASATQVIWIDQGFDAIDWRSPANNAIVGGTVCFDGTVNDTCFQNYTVAYRPAGSSGAYTPVDPSRPTYTSAVVNDPFASWNSRSVPEGNYDVRVQGTTVCGRTLALNRTFTIDNTAPTALISSPMNCDNVLGTVTIRGTAFDAHPNLWVLEYTGGDSHGWTTISTGNSNIVNGVLGTWNTASLRPCSYTLRLRVYDAATVNCSSTHYSEYHTSLRVGCPADLDDGSGTGLPDGGVTIDDLLYFLSRFNSGC
jgi:hypothetical protein